MKRLLRKRKEMFRRFYPKAQIDSTYNIDFDVLWQKGYRGVMFDIDNTLVMHGAPATPEAIDFFDRLRKKGFDTCLISNNKIDRVKSFATQVKSKYIYDAHKPSIKNYVKAMELMNTDRSNTVFVGDQLFTDVYGANRAGIKTILVSPINPKEEIQIVLKRYLEKIVMHFYKGNGGSLDNF